MKECKGCHELLPLSEFPVRKRLTGHYPMARCHGCRKEQYARYGYDKANHNTRRPFADPVDFLPFPPPLVKVALVWTLGRAA